MIQKEEYFSSIRASPAISEIHTSDGPTMSELLMTPLLQRIPGSDLDLRLPISVILGILIIQEVD